MSGLRTALHALVLTLTALFSVEQFDYSFEESHLQNELESVHTLGDHIPGYTILSSTISNSFLGGKNFSPATITIEEGTKSTLSVSIPDQCTTANENIKIRLQQIIYPFHSFW